MLTQTAWKCAGMRLHICKQNKIGVTNSTLPSLRVNGGHAADATASASRSAMAAADALPGAHIVPVLLLANGSIHSCGVQTDPEPQLVFNNLCI